MGKDMSADPVKTTINRAVNLINGTSVLTHRITFPPYSIHLGEKFLIHNDSKVKSSQSEVQIGVSIL